MSHKKYIAEDLIESLMLLMIFRNQPSLLRLSWNKKITIDHSHSRYLENDSHLLLFFEKGPLATLRLFSTSGLKNDIQSSGLTPDNLIYHYISKNQIDQAISILSNLSWEKYGVSCLMSLQRIVNHLFRQKLTPDKESQIQRTLGTFYQTNHAVNQSIMQEFGDQVKDIARKFFHLLVRYCLFEKAFCLAIDINDYDLFMDLYYYADQIQNSELAAASLNKAKEILNNETSESSTCSKSECSECSDDNDYNEDPVREWNNKNKNFDIPPLPVPKTKFFSYKLPPLPITNLKSTVQTINFTSNTSQANKFFNDNSTNLFVSKSVNSTQVTESIQFVDNSSLPIFTNFTLPKSNAQPNQYINDNLLPQPNQFVGDNFQKISISNTNFIKPRLDFNPINHLRPR